MGTDACGEMMSISPPFNWFGGKQLLSKQFVKMIPPHKVYVEVFGGAASLLFAKLPSPLGVYNDLHSGLVNFFRVLRDEQKTLKLAELVEKTPYSREEYIFCLDNWQNEADDVKKAWAWFVQISASFGGGEGHGHGWSFGRQTSKSVTAWARIPKRLLPLHKRFKSVQIEQADFETVLEHYDSTNTFFYLDPPYVLDTRKGGGYVHEMNIGDHERLVDALLKIKGNAILSGYTHDVYRPLENAGWRTMNFDVVASCTLSKGIGNAIKNHKRTEVIWIKTHNNAGVNAFIKG